MKRTISLILTAIFALCMLLSACEKTGGGSALSDVAESNRKKAEVRRSFLESAQYAAAYEYVENAISELAGTEGYRISLEPGRFYREGFSAFDNIAEDEAQRTTFFEYAYLSIVIPFWESGADGETIARHLADRGISCTLEADEYSSAYYEINGRDKTVVYTMRPEV